MQLIATEEIVAPLPVIDVSKCRYCGVCAGFCPQKAIQFNRFIPSVTLVVSRCYACGNCLKGCSRNGIKLRDKICGTILKGSLGKHSFIAGCLDDTSGFEIPLINALLERLNPDLTVVCDFGPGTGSPVEAGLAGMDIALLVAQPGPGWETDMDLLLELIQKSHVDAGLILNKVIPGSEIIDDIRVYCTNHSFPLLGIIPFDKNLEDDSDFHTFANRGTTMQGFSEIWKQVVGMFKVPLAVKN
ncbi:MAG: 4Fe-4S dicluster domain-containing protein [Bacteroidota bacterium]